MNSRLLKGAFVGVATALGALSAIGCMLAIHFEMVGFGRIRDTQPRLSYLFLLALGFFFSVTAPAFLWCWLFEGAGRSWLIAMAVGTVFAVAMLGISLRW